MMRMQCLPQRTNLAIIMVSSEELLHACVWKTPFTTIIARWQLHTRAKIADAKYQSEPLSLMLLVLG